MKLQRRVLLLSAVALSCMAFSQAGDGQFNDRHNILISDQFNNRVIEVDRAGKIVWSFGNGSPNPGAASVGAPNDAQRVGDLTLISGTGTTAVADNRVLLVDQRGKIVWQYGQAGVAGTADNQLNTPVAAVYLPNGDILITDQANQRIIEVNEHHHVVWQYGQTGVAGVGAGQLNNPNSAEVLDNGDMLIADESNNRVFEINKAKKIVWSYGTPANTVTLNAPAFASRLDNGLTVISDSGNNRIVEVNSKGVQVGEYVTNLRAGSVANPNPTRAVHLRNGDTLISDQFNNQVIEVDSLGAIVFTYGTIGVTGNGANQLNGVYDAKQIDDFTGLTAPYYYFDHGHGHHGLD